MMYVCDNQRHLICVPYSIDNLHIMADDLNINRCWFRNKKPKGTALRKPHYDIPVKRMKEIQDKCVVVPYKTIMKIIKDSYETTL